MKSLTPRLWLSLLGAGIGITAIVVAVLLLDGDTPGESPSPSLTEPAPESSVAPAPVAAPLPTTEPSIPPSAAAPDPGEEVVIPTSEEDAPTPPEPPEEDAPTPPEQPAEPTPEQPTAPDQPLAPSSPSPSGYAVTDLLHSDRLGFVLGFESFPNGDGEVALVAREGHLWRWDTGRGDEPTLFADISDRVHAGGEEGLLGLAFSPAYPSDRQLYLYYSAAGPRRSVLSRFTVVGETVDAASEEILLEVAQPFANHNGGQLTFGPDGMLYLALGDGGSGGDPLGHGQNLTTLLGSILRLHVSAPGPYRIPLDNPFVDLPGAQPEIFAHGLRNPWRFSFDSATGALWAGDVGQGAWEEVDRIVAGGNYGWNILEGFACFTTPDCDRTGLQLPRAVYGHDDQGGCSITGGFVYRGAALPELDGWYLYGDLCSGRLWALNTADDSEPILLLDDLAGSLVTFGVLPGEELAVVTINGGATISRLERRAP